MSKGELLPVPQRQSKLPLNIKEGIKRAGKITKYSLLTMGFGIATAGTIAIAPVLTIPAVVGLAYNGQKLLNNTIYKSYNDLAFITKKQGTNIKIFQDATRTDITKSIKEFTDVEKAGFMQLQAIIGMTKFNKQDKKGNILTFSTRSHGITRKTFKKLNDLGYIENYQDHYKKDSRLILPKLAFGNFKALKDKVEMYDIQFNLSDKELDITDPKLQKAFPIVFGRRGLIQKRGYEIVPDGKGGLTFKVENNNQQTYMYSRDNQEENELKDGLRKKGVPTYEQQKKYSKEYGKHSNLNIQKNEKDKQL